MKSVGKITTLEDLQQWFLNPFADKEQPIWSIFKGSSKKPGDRIMPNDNVTNLQESWEYLKDTLTRMNGGNFTIWVTDKVSNKSGGRTVEVSLTPASVAPVGIAGISASQPFAGVPGGSIGYINDQVDAKINAYKLNQLKAENDRLRENQKEDGTRWDQFMDMCINHILPAVAPQIVGAFTNKVNPSPTSITGVPTAADEQEDLEDQEQTENQSVDKIKKINDAISRIDAIDGFDAAEVIESVSFYIESNPEQAKALLPS